MLMCVSNSCDSGRLSHVNLQMRRGFTLFSGSSCDSRLATPRSISKANVKIGGLSTVVEHLQTQGQYIGRFPHPLSVFAFGVTLWDRTNEIPGVPVATACCYFLYVTGRMSKEAGFTSYHTLHQLATSATPLSAIAAFSLVARKNCLKQIACNGVDNLRIVYLTPVVMGRVG